MNEEQADKLLEILGQIQQDISFFKQRQLLIDERMRPSKFILIPKIEQALKLEGRARVDAIISLIRGETK